MRGPPLWWLLIIIKNQNHQNLNRKKKSNIFLQTFSKSITITQVKRETKECKVQIDICKNQNHQKWNRKKNQFFLFFWKIRFFFLSVRNAEGQKGENFSKIFFFEFLVQNDSIRKKKQNVGDFDPFDPWRENQSFFWYGVFAKC